MRTSTVNHSVSLTFEDPYGDYKFSFPEKAAYEDIVKVLEGILSAFNRLLSEEKLRGCGEREMADQ